jgi:hypothetical protein
MMMKRLFALSGFTLALLVVGPSAYAQSMPPPLPTLNAQQSSAIKQRLDLYRSETEGRVTRGEISADEADRLLKWREWQIARQVVGASAAPPATAYDSPPPDYYEQRSPDYVVVEPPPYYGPYYRYAAPYWGPRPYYWGPAICAGGFGRHFGGRLCF